MDIDGLWHLKPLQYIKYISLYHLAIDILFRLGGNTDNLYSVLYMIYTPNNTSSTPLTTALCETVSISVSAS